MSGKNTKLKAQKREKEKNLYDLRKKDWVPGVVYGAGFDSLLVKVPKVEIEKAFDAAGYSTLVDLEIEGGETLTVIFKEIQRSAVKYKYIHVDFYKVDMTKKIETTVPLEFIGEPPAVKEMGGYLMKNLEEVDVKCLPSEFIHEIKIDVSGLKTFDDYIRLVDLKLPENVELIAEDMETVVASVIPPKEESEEDEEKSEADAVAEVKVEKEVKEEDKEEKSE